MIRQTYHDLRIERIAIYCYIYALAIVFSSTIGNLVFIYCTRQWKKTYGLIASEDWKFKVGTKINERNFCVFV